MYYKDMEVYKEAIDFTIDIYNITEKFPKSELYGLVNQMRRSVVSIPSNIAEGSARYSGKDTMRFVGIAIGSLAELDTQLIIANRLGYLDDIDIFTEKVNKLSALLRGLKNYLEKTHNDTNLST